VSERLTLNGGVCAMASTDYCESQEDCYLCGHGKKMRLKLAEYEAAERERAQSGWTPCAEGLPLVSGGVETTIRDSDGELVKRIVQSLRCDGYCSRCEKWDGGDLPCPVMIEAADRLERQERENASLRAENKGLHKEIIRRGIEIKAMTARAEQAERERDAAVADLKLGKVCMTCKHDEKCRREVSETNQTQCIGRQRWTWRGLPQEGEGV
jgi:uncharacterized protein (UPF0335 family)